MVPPNARAVSSEPPKAAAPSVVEKAASPNATSPTSSPSKAASPKPAGTTPVQATASPPPPKSTTHSTSSSASSSSSAGSPSVTTSPASRLTSTTSVRATSTSITTPPPTTKLPASSASSSSQPHSSPIPKPASSAKPPPPSSQPTPPPPSSSGSHVSSTSHTPSSTTHSSSGTSGATTPPFNPTHASLSPPIVDSPSPSANSAGAGVSGLPTAVADSTTAGTSILNNTRDTVLLFTFVGVIVAVGFIGLAVYYWCRSRANRRFMAASTEFLRFKRANSTASASSRFSHRPLASTPSSTRNSHVPEGADSAAHYQPQRLMGQPRRSPVWNPESSFAPGPAVHRAIWPDILPTIQQQHTLVPDAPPSQGQALPPSLPPPPRPPPRAAERTLAPTPALVGRMSFRPPSPESYYDEDSVYSGVGAAGVGAHGRSRPYMIERRPVPEPPARAI